MTENAQDEKLLQKFLSQHMKFRNIKIRLARQQTLK